MVHKDRDSFEHRQFKDLIGYLKSGDVLVMNDTKVLPARIFGTRISTGAKLKYYC
ncbi:hypothetical protein N752_04415 [Desulforamulus aquiferis]|nr:hypothetical protein N752_04415 [Desulforamulus aquiferis]